MLANKRDLLLIKNQAEMFQTFAGKARIRVAYNVESSTVTLNTEPFWTLEINQEHLHVQVLEPVSKVDSCNLRK